MNESGAMGNKNDGERESDFVLSSQTEDTVNGGFDILKAPRSSFSRSAK